MRSTDGQWKWGWYLLFKAVSKLQWLTVKLDMWKLTFKLTDYAMLFLDKADGGYPEYREEDW